MLVDYHRCLRCGHEWVTSTNDNLPLTPPKKCPKCKSAKWDKVHKIVAQ